MLRLETVNPGDRRQVKRFVDLPYRLYAHCPQWVPPLRSDARLLLNRQAHPFYQHSEAAFFLATRAGRDVGRCAVLEHRLFNRHHAKQWAQFYLFECEDDAGAAEALLTRAAEWARARGLSGLLGPKGFSLLDGFGLLVDGFEHLQTMSLTNYNFDYYPHQVEALGFAKHVDLISCYVDPASFRRPEWVEGLADVARQRGELTVRHYATLPQLVRAGPELVRVYYRALANNWEYYPLQAAEVEFAVDNLKWISHPRLLKSLDHRGEMVGLLGAFPDISPALRRARGNLTPWSLADLWWSVRRRPAHVAVAIMGILPEHRLNGGGALLLSELGRAILDLGVSRAELLQIPDSALQMRRDLAALDIRAHKTHRVYFKAL